MTIYEMCFSPTGGTKKVADLLAKDLAQDVRTVDLTDSRMDFSGVALTGEDVAVIAVPSYGGRMPEPAAERLAMTKGNGARAVIVCVYGNRAYEDTLVELQDTAKAAGFRVVAAVAAVAEHSIAREFATGRPDAQDQAELHQFAERIHSKLASGACDEPEIPGNRPYKKASGAGMVPKPTKECVACGLCAAKCPVQAIDATDVKAVDSKVCISCMRCVSICPHSARKVNGMMLAAVHAMLKKACTTRKNDELFC